MTTVSLPFGDLVNEQSSTVPYLSDFTGWLDSIERESQKDQRPGGYGFFDDDDPDIPGRTLTVFGEYRVAGGEWETLQRQVTSLAALGWFDLTVKTGIVRTARVRVEGRIEFAVIDERGYADFSIPLLAPDSRKYGPVQTAPTGLPVAGGGVLSPVTSPFSQVGGGSPGRIALANAGTADTDPTFTVAGGAISGGVELTRIETGERLRLEWPLLATDTVVFDSGTGQVWLNDQAAISGYLTKAQWWSLGPGESATVQFAALGDVTGTPVLTGTWRDADA